MGSICSRRAPASPAAQNAEDTGFLYPMWVVSMQKFLSFNEVEPHQVLARRGDLVQYTPGMGPVIFVSHEWAGFNHPDPDMRQLKVFQEALRNVLAGKAKIGRDMIAMFAGVQKFTKKDRALLAESFVWYDYFAVPQIKARTTEQVVPEDVAKAVASFPAYAQASRFFIVVAPSICHVDANDRLLTYETWKGRGWCRVERAARALSDGDMRMILVTNVHNMMICWTDDYLNHYPSRGAFTVEEDRKTVARIMDQMVEKKVAACEQQGRVPDRNFFMAWRENIAEELPSAGGQVWIPQRSLSGLPLGHGPPSPRAAAECFLDKFGFRSALEYDRGGRNALHYAAIAGLADAAKGLLQLRADVHDCVSQFKKTTTLIDKGMHPLHLAALFATRTEVLVVLLHARADVHSTDDFGHEPLHSACNGGGAGCLAAAKLLLDAAADLEKVGCFGSTPLVLTVSRGDYDIARFLLDRGASATHTDFSKGNALHTNSLNGGNPNLVALLAAAGCPVNGQIGDFLTCARRVPEPHFYQRVQLVAYTVCKIVYMCGKRSPLVVFFARGGGATPLMLAAMFGRRDVARALLAEDADVTLRSHNGMSASEWAQLFGQPQDFIAELAVQPPRARLVSI